MDSKARQEIGIPSARLPEVHSDQMRLRRVNHWLTLAVVVLAVGLTATGVGLIAQSGEEPASRATIGPATEVAQGSATAEVVAVLDANFAAMNAGDREALADAYNRDAVVTDAIAGEFKGVDEIVGFYIEAPGYWQLERVSDVVQVGDFSVFAFTYFGGSGILVYPLDGDLKIVHQWIMGT